MNMEKEANASWDNWKNFLGHAVEFAEELGISHDQISSLAQQAGNILADNVTPKTPEQEVLRELWQVSDQNEQETLAKLMTKLSLNETNSND